MFVRLEARPRIRRQSAPSAQHRRAFCHESSNAGCPGIGVGRFRIIHPFHPLCGAEYELVTRKLTWGEDRVFYYDANGRLKSLMTNVTDVVERDAFDRVSAGRSAFRIDDLLELRRLFKRRKVGGEEADSV